MLVIGRSPVLKISEGFWNDTVGVWVKGDNRFKGPDVKRICMHVLGDIL